MRESEGGEGRKRRKGRESGGEWEAYVVKSYICSSRTSIWTDCRLGTS